MSYYIKSQIPPDLLEYFEPAEIGLEETPTAYVEQLVAVFREVRRVMKDDGTLWLNLGDSYANDGKWGGQTGGKHARALHGGATANGRNKKCTGYKPKNLMGIPWQVAFALRGDGWYLRSDIIWHKPNPMPESVTDRPTRSHEYIFLLTKSDKYSYDHEAIKVPGSRRIRDTDKQRGHSRRHAGFNDRRDAMERDEQISGAVNRRDVWAEEEDEFEQFLAWKASQPSAPDVWKIPPANYPGSHFATFPPALIEPCVKAGCPAGGVILDPFNGSGTTGMVAQNWGRRYIGIDINAEYLELSKQRLCQGMLNFSESHTTGATQ